MLLEDVMQQFDILVIGAGLAGLVAATEAVEIRQPRSPVASGSFFAMASAARRIMLKLPTRLTMMVLV